MANLSRCSTNFFHFLFGTFTVVNLSFGLPIGTFQCFMLIGKLLQKYCSNSTKASTAVKCINLILSNAKKSVVAFCISLRYSSPLCSERSARNLEQEAKREREARTMKEKIVCAAYYLYVQHKTNGSSFSVTFLRTNITVTFNRRFFFVCIHNFMALSIHSL